MTPEEIARRYQIRRLGKEDHILTFDCGDNDLNDFILNESPRYRSARLAVTYVIEVKESDHVVGFFSLANDRVSISDFESKTEFNRFRKKRFVNEKRIKSYPTTVDAYINAVPFYLKNKFLPLNSDPDLDSDHTKLLFFDLEEIEE